MEDVLFLTDDHGVTGVRSTLVAHDDVVLRGEEVDQFALSFVAPLGTKDTERRH